MMAEVGVGIKTAAKAEGRLADMTARRVLSPRLAGRDSVNLDSASPVLVSLVSARIGPIHDATSGLVIGPRGLGPAEISAVRAADGLIRVRRSVPLR